MSNALSQIRPWNVRLGDLIQVRDEVGMVADVFDVEVTREPIKGHGLFSPRRSRYVIGVRSHTYHNWNPTELVFYSDDYVQVRR